MRKDWIKPYSSDEYIVLCPICGFECLHHGAVQVYVRDEEDGDTTVIQIGDHEPARENPSGRRGAIGIKFQGECGHEFEMLVVQHKGTTYLQFRE